MTALTIEIPRKAREVLLPDLTPDGLPVRYRCLYGGRDGGKSHSIGRMLLARGMSRPTRILCVREVQKSIADSVHRLLSDLIKALDIEAFYTIQQNYIIGANGTRFNFHGLSGETAMSLKSHEGTDIAWIEEAQTISKRSWDILEPTIRAPGSELWLSFNPALDSDETYRKFVLSPPKDALIAKINFSDNPWRSAVLDAAREKMQRDAPDDYAHIYLGECRPAVEGSIYFKEVAALKTSSRFGAVPYDPMLRVHVIADLGFNDFMSLLLVQKVASSIRVIRYIEDRMRDIPSYSQEMKDLKLNWGKVWLPHDAKAKTLISANNPNGVTAEQQFKKLGWKTEMVPNVDIEQGIRKAREVFPRVAVDRDNAADLVSRLGRYRRRVNSLGQASTPVHDDESHGSDGFRYLALVADQLQNDEDSEIVTLTFETYAA